MRFFTSLAVAALTLSVAAPLAAQAQTVDPAVTQPARHHAVHKTSHKTHAKKHAAKVHRVSHKTHHVAKALQKQS
jgi:Spy/CpxP family protein refolding chaperone